MKNTIVRCLLTLSLSCSALVFMNNASAISPDFRIVGIAMHQETGRNIYLGAVHQNKDLPDPGDLNLLPAPKIMEYKVVARRTSLRSLLGNMLLQGEVATGNSPSAATLAFADNLLSAVKGSLYAGDSFDLKLDAEGQLTASLNGITMTSVPNDGIFDFLLMGWISENGPSTTFRSSITNPMLDSSLLSVYEAHNASADRVSVVIDWLEPADELPAIAAVTSAETTMDAEEEEVDVTTPAAEPEAPSIDIAAAATVATTVPSTDTVVAQATPAASEPASTSETEPAADPEELIATNETLEESIEALDITEYSYRLAGFNTSVMKLVYTQIQYPRRAVRRNIQGTLELDITMLEDGTFVGAEVAESSGFSILDSAALEAAEDAFASASLGDVDPVAVAEYSNGDGENLIVPVPVAFILQ